MPVVAIPALVAVVAAIVALLVLYGIAYITKAVGNLMPDWNIPGYSALRRWVLAAASITLDATRNAMTSALAPVGKLIEYPFLVIQNLTDAVVRNIARALSTLHWVVNTYVPHLVGNLRTALLDRLGNLRAWAVGALAATYHHAITWAHDHISALSARVDADVARIAGRIDGIASRVANLAARIGTAAAAAEAAAIAKARAYTDQRVKAMAGDVADVAGAVKAGVTTAEHYADRAVRAGVSTAETYATRAAQAAAAGVATSAVTAAAAAWPTITDEADKVAGVLGADLPGIGAAVRAIPRVVPTDMADVIAGVTAIAVPALRYLERCGIPNCRNLSAFGRDLQDVLSLIGDGLALAALAELVTDPAAAAAAVRADLVAPVQGLVGEARSLLGVG